MHLHSIPLAKCEYWFMQKLNKLQRAKLRKHYVLDAPTLKITNQIIKEVYEIEMEKPFYERLFESRFYNYN